MIASVASFRVRAIYQAVCLHLNREFNAMLKTSNPPTVAPPAAMYSHCVEVPPNARWLFTAGQVGVRTEIFPLLIFLGGTVLYVILTIHRSPLSAPTTFSITPTARPWMIPNAGSRSGLFPQVRRQIEIRPG